MHRKNPGGPGSSTTGGRRVEVRSRFERSDRHRRRLLARSGSEDDDKRRGATESVESSDVSPYLVYSCQSDPGLVSVGCYERGRHTMTEDSQNAVSRRNFIKGVIAGGAAVSSASYLFRTATVSGQQTGAAGAVERLITLNVNGQNRPVDVMKQETLAMTLRYKLGLTGHQAGMRPGGVRRVHGAHRRCAALFVLDPDALGARQEGDDDRRPRRGRRHAASGAAGRGRGTGVPVCVLHAGLRDGDGRAISRPIRIRRGRNWRTGCRAICAAARITTRSSPRSAAVRN